MHRRYFPSCPIDGPIEPPVPFGHMASRGAVPKKCAECQHLFEGECTRNIQEVGHYLHLDHGPCGIDGPTDPVVYEDQFIQSKVEIPRKCSNCNYLGFHQVFGFLCRKDAGKWGDFHRGLDWGTWVPDSIDLQLALPKVSTKELCLYARQNDMMAFIREYRRINPGFTIEEARADFNHFRNVIAKSWQK